MYKLVIGIDVSKDVLDIAYRFKNDVEYLKKVENSDKGIADFLAALMKITGLKSTDSWLVCFENTGVYSKLLLTTLWNLDIDCVEENAMQIKIYSTLKRGKRDDWDAIRICEFAYAHQDSLILSGLNDENLEKLQHLFNFRTLLVQKRIALNNAVSEKQSTLDFEFIKGIVEANNKVVDVINEQVKLIEKQMHTIINSNEALKKNYKLTTSVIGIGEIIGIGLIIKTGNFKKFDCPKKFAAHIGIAPFPKQSGKSYSNPKVSKFADKVMKALISNGVTAAIAFDPQLKKYSEKLKEAGKANGIRRNNIKNKLIQRVFAVIKRETPFVKIAA